MTTMQYAGPIEVVTIGIEPGEMLLETIRDALKKHDIRNGVVVSGIGALKSCHLHHIEHRDFPPSNRFFTIEKPLELSSISGIIADGEPHLHAVVSYADKESYSGHLEDGSEVLYLAEVVILVFNGLKMTRHFDEQRGIRLLRPKR
ncbi:PPC domain-containing DNA-binding protein [Chloroflexota bacterium]